MNFLNTYQGRYSMSSGRDSTNGCTVIAPLIGYRHIKTPGARLPNSHIEHVIDNDCPPILSRIRAKHSLGPGAFIVPADVHDYLYDEGLMDPNIFGGVFGGSVLDEEHMDPLFDTLEAFPPNEGACAAFFFHEHVTAVLKSREGYEFVDSLPYPPRGMGVRIRCG